jgi:uncharacterized membrane protein YhaH (DUF805 family)
VQFPPRTTEQQIIGEVRCEAGKSGGHADSPKATAEALNRLVMPWKPSRAVTPTSGPIIVLISQAVARVIDFLFGGFLFFGPVLGLVGLVLAVAVRRLHDHGRPGRELLVPCVMLALLPLVLSLGGFLPRIVGLGYAGLTLLVFANLLLLFLKDGKKVPNRCGASPTAFTFAR